MTRERTGDAGREERLNDVLLAYVEEVEAGRAPNRHRLLAEHPDLRRDLEEFLAGHDEVERLAAPFREAAREQDAPSRAALEIGQLGDFRLLGEVGRGGMGVVYEAEQISLRRRVALKVLPFAAAIDPRQLERFKNEALAAAHLRHEHIVPVYAVGCERGVHYYAMQFIEGQSLAALIRELRREQGSGAEGEAAGTKFDTSCSLFTDPWPLTPGAAGPTAASLSRARAAGGRRYFDWLAGLGRQAALALEHAHQAGIVHRDVKPANLLLDARGQIWVADFGLARVTGDAGLTATGELLGTLRYASPEQALTRRGVVDHRSDVYSLGATLYELLTLRPLFAGRDRRELLRQIADDEPRPPRSLEPAVPAELETILLKALRKEPADRYATAQDLADDLQRFLDDRPIRARRPTPVERLQKWGRRHPTAVAAGAIVLLLLSVGSLTSAALIRGEQGRTRAAQLRAESAYHRERQRAEEAEARFRLARRSVDELVQVSEEELADRPGLEGVRKRLLRSALAFYQEFVAQRRDDPDAQAELRDTTRRVEQILADLAVLRAASKLYLLCQPAVLDDLRLKAEQREKVKEFTARVGKEWVESFGEFGRLSAAERGRRALARARAYEAEVNVLLRPAQQSRLHQIGLQSEGSGTFSQPEVVAGLRLTAGQRTQIRTIEEEVFFGRLRAAAPGPAPKANHRPAIERILTVLTDEQARRWREMSGEPVQGVIASFGVKGASK
jgi:serine/threonine protein kinase